MQLKHGSYQVKENGKLLNQSFPDFQSVYDFLKDKRDDFSITYSWLLRQTKAKGSYTFTSADKSYSCEIILAPREHFELAINGKPVKSDFPAIRAARTYLKGLHPEFETSYDTVRRHILNNGFFSYSADGGQNIYTIRRTPH